MIAIESDPDHCAICGQPAAEHVCPSEAPDDDDPPFGPPTDAERCERAAARAEEAAEQCRRHMRAAEDLIVLAQQLLEEIRDRWAARQGDPKED